MYEEWTNLQVMECEADEGSLITVFKQSDGKQCRYVLGNGRLVALNGDGSFTIPGTSEMLSVAAVH